MIVDQHLLLYTIPKVGGKELLKGVNNLRKND